jgi:hypothetical protein
MSLQESAEDHAMTSPTAQETLFQLSHMRMCAVDVSQDC